VRYAPCRGTREGAESTGEDGDETRRPEKPNYSTDEDECARVGEVESVESNMSRDVEEGAGADDDEERRAGSPRSPHEGYSESGDPGDKQVDPGGDTDVKRNEGVAPENGDTATNGEVAGTRRAV
jgi:hypothetical protein